MRAYKFSAILSLICFLATQGLSAYAICGHCPGDKQPSESASSASAPTGGAIARETATMPTTQSTAGLENSAIIFGGAAAPTFTDTDLSVPPAPGVTEGAKNINKALDKAFFDGFYFDKPETIAAPTTPGQNKPLKQSQVQIGGPIQADHVVNKKPPADKVIPNADDQSMFKGYVDNVFSGSTSDMVQLRFTWQESVKDPKTGEVLKDAARKDAGMPADLKMSGGQANRGAQTPPAVEKSNGSGGAKGDDFGPDLIAH